MNEKDIQNFNTALNLYENNYSHAELINFLKNGSDVEKQAAALKLEKIEDQAQADIFMGNLTGCDGKIREAVSFRLPEFVSEKPELFTSFADIFLDAIIDINGNICRNTISALQNLKNFETFTNTFCKKLTLKASEIIPAILAFDIQEGKYKINKEVFKLYWYLETIYQFCECINDAVIFEIINKTKDINDYTIREKTAKIISKIKGDENFSKIREELKNDKNYYVRRF